MTASGTTKRICRSIKSTGTRVDLSILRGSYTTGARRTLSALFFSSVSCSRVPSVFLLICRVLLGALTLAPWSLCDKEIRVNLWLFINNQTICPIKFCQSHLNLNRFKALKCSARNAIWPARTAKVFRLLLSRRRCVHVSKRNTYHLATLKTKRNLLFWRVVLNNFCHTQRSLNDSIALWSTVLKVAIGFKLIAQAAH